MSLPRQPRSGRGVVSPRARRGRPLVPLSVSRGYTAPRTHVASATPDSPNGYVDMVTRQKVTAHHVKEVEDALKHPPVKTVRATLSNLREQVIQANARAAEMERELSFFKTRSDNVSKNKGEAPAKANDLDTLTPERYTRLHELFLRTQKRLDEKTAQCQQLELEKDQLQDDFKQFKRDHNVRNTVTRMRGAVVQSKAENLKATNTVMRQTKSRLSREMTKLHRTTNQLEGHNERLQLEVNHLTAQLEAALVERDAALQSRGLTSRGNVGESVRSSLSRASLPTLSRPGTAPVGEHRAMQTDAVEMASVEQQTDNMPDEGDVKGDGPGGDVDEAGKEEGDKGASDTTTTSEGKGEKGGDATASSTAMNTVAKDDGSDSNPDFATADKGPIGDSKDGDSLGPTMMTEAEAQELVTEAAGEVKRVSALELAKVETELAAVRGQFDETVKELGDVNEKYATVLTEKDEQAATITEHSERISSLESALTAKTTAIDKLENDVVSLKTQLGDEHKAHAGTKKELSSLKKEVDTIPVKLRVTSNADG